MGSIYKITNTINGKSYIGQTTRKQVADRIDKHLNGHPGGSLPLKQDVEKYGRDAFAVEVLHGDIIPELLNNLEIKSIQEYNTVSPNGYNLTQGGNKPPSRKDKTVSVETRKKMSKAHKSPSAETRRKMSEAKQGNRYHSGKTHSPETKRKMSASQKKAWKTRKLNNH